MEPGPSRFQHLTNTAAAAKARARNIAGERESKLVAARARHGFDLPLDTVV
jgi:hypothetical protein